MAPITPSKGGRYEYRMTPSRVGRQPRTPPVTPRNPLRRAAADVSGAVLGYIAGNLPGAITGYNLADRAMDSLEAREAEIEFEEAPEEFDQLMEDATGNSLPTTGMPKRVAKKTGKTSKKIIKRKNKKSWKSAKSSKKVRKYSKKSKLHKPSTMFDSYEKSGCVYISENSGEVNAITYGTQYIGHSTVGLKSMIRTALLATVKILCKRAGIQIPDTNTIIGGQDPGSKGANTYVQLGYSNNEIANGGTGATGDIGIVVIEKNLSSTLYEIAEYFYNTLVAFWSSQYRLVYVRLVTKLNANADEIPLAYVSLKNALVDVCVTSNMKMQNRTVKDSGDGDQQLQVDRQVLHGKEYWGKGNGTDITLNGSGNWGSVAPINQSNRTMPAIYADRDSGTILNGYEITPTNSNPGQGAPSTDTSDDYIRKTLNQPLSSRYFNAVKRERNIVMNSGPIYVSKLFYKKTIAMSTLFKFMDSTDQYAANKVGFGNFKMYGVEKMIKITTQTLASKEALPLKIAYDHEYKIGCNVKENIKGGTLPRLESTSLVPIL